MRGGSAGSAGSAVSVSWCGAGSHPRGCRAGPLAAGCRLPPVSCRCVVDVLLTRPVAWLIALLARMVSWHRCHRRSRARRWVGRVLSGFLSPPTTDYPLSSLLHCLTSTLLFAPSISHFSNSSSCMHACTHAHIQPSIHLPPLCASCLSLPPPYMAPQPTCPTTLHLLSSDQCIVCRWRRNITIIIIYYHHYYYFFLLFFLSSSSSPPSSTATAAASASASAPQHRYCILLPMNAAPYIVIGLAAAHFSPHHLKKAMREVT
ncbi:hypothetical protein TSMEX_000992 [Taenia solium]|eukprot:TsM_000081000 transcript=TsM_000081000 gene=TsM_000081000